MGTLRMIGQAKAIQLLLAGYFQMVLALVLLVVLSARASEVSSLEQTVTSSQQISSNSSNYTEWTQEDLQAWGPIVLSEFLEKQGIFQSKKSGGTGSPIQLNIRGLDLRYTSITLDGVLLSTQSNPQAVLQRIPIQNIKSIKVHFIHPNSLTHGSLGGSLIEIITLRKQELSGSYRGASFGEHNLGLNYSQPLGAHLWSTYFQGLQAENNYPFLDDNGTAYQASDDRITERQNNQVSNLQGGLGLRSDMDSWVFNQKLQMISLNRGLPGLGSNQAKDSYFKEEIIQYSLQAQEQASDALQFNLSHFYRQDELYYSREDQIWFVPQEHNYWTNEQRNTQLSLSKKVNFSSSWSSQFSSFNQYEVQRVLRQVNAYETRDITYDWNRNQHSIGGDLYYHSKSWSHHLLYQAIMYWDYSSLSEKFSHNHNYQYSSQFHFNSHWSLSQGISQATQVMSLQDQFGLSPGLLPNPELKSERILKLFSSLNHQTSSSLLRLDAFFTQVEDRIAYQQSLGVAKAINGLDMVNYGLEVQAQKSWLNTSNYTPSLQMQLLYQSPRLQGELQNYDQNRPAQISPLTASLIYRQQIHAFHFNQSARWIYEHYADNANRERIDSQLWLDTWIQWNQEAYAIQIGAENWTNQQDQSLYQYLPIPGRRFYAQFSFQIFNQSKKDTP